MKKEILTQHLRHVALCFSFLITWGLYELHAQQGCAISSQITQTFTQTTPIEIPTGPGVISSTIVVAGANTQIVEIELQTFITHLSNADLDITLVSPEGTIVTLTTDNGGVNDHVFNGTIWDDDANPGGQVPYAANNGLVTDHTYVNLVTATPLAPEEPLAAFNGENPNGIWTLFISDDLAANGGSLNSWSLFVTSGVVPAVTVTTVANNTPVLIPDVISVVSSTINAAGLNTYLRNLRVMTNITHTFNADLDITLTSPAGTVVTLTTDNGGGNDNSFAGTLWDNDANPGGNVPYTNNQGMVTDHLYTNLVLASPLTPEESFGAFFGENPNGTWTLTISDDLGGDGGNLNSWSIEFSTIPNQTCDFVLPLPVLTLNAAPNVCSATSTFNVPPTTGLCTGVMYSYRLDNGPIIPIMGSSVTLTIPLGFHAITWFSVTECGTVMATQTVNVVDVTPPAIVCPADVQIILDPGACEAAVGFNVTATDNCGIILVGGAENTFQVPNQILPHGFGAIVVNTNTLPGGVMFNLTNTTGEDIYIQSLEVRFGDVAFGAIPAVVPVSVYTSIGNTYVGITGNAAAWNPVALNVPVTVAGPNSQFSEVPLPGNGLLLPAGVTKGVYVMGTTHSILYNNAANSTLTPFVGDHLTLVSGVGSATLFGATFGPPRTPNVRFNYALASELMSATQTSGLPSGSFFPIGTTTNCFIATDVFGNTGTCCFNVVVAEFPFPTTTLACNDHIQVSVNENCEAFISTDMILEGGPYGCYDDYIVAVSGFGSGFGGVLINSNAIGQTLTVTVTDPTTGNSCWGTIRVEDKIPPTIECRDVTILCGEALPNEPFPALIGPQQIIYSGLNDPLDIPPGQNITYNYEFDYSFLPSGTSVEDVDVQFTILDHSFTGDVNIQVISPSGTSVDVFIVGGCAGPFPINTWFDDEGVNPVDCNGLDLPRILPVFNGGATIGPNLFNLDGEDASGTWIVRVFDDFPALDGGNILSVGLSITVNVQAIEPSDNCGAVTFVPTDTQFGDPCEELTIQRLWTATDNSGNTATCIQNITVLPLVLDSVDCPPAFVGECGDSTHPNNTGWPTVNGTPITDANNVCNIFVGYWDKELADCGEGVKLVRTWTILDWCTQSVLECIQVIKMSDDQPPLITCPPNMTVGTDFWYCFANVNIPKPTVVDACGSSWTLTLTASSGVIIPFGTNFRIDQLGLGLHTVTWRATDECGNSSTCSFTIRVIDNVVPVALCDEHTIVALTNDGPFGVTLVPATVFDDGSYDNCGPVTFRARRMDSCINFDWTTEGACIDHIPGGVPPVNSRDRGTVHRPCVPFACCDVGAGPVMVELEVTDASGNVNFCMVEVEVQDKISPFVICPPDIIVSCDFWFAVEEGTFNDVNNNGMLDEDVLSPVFGNMFDAFRFNDDESVRQDIIINDPGNNTISQPHFWGIDGWADDNCEVNLSVRVRIIDDCSGDALPANAPPGAVRLIERRFSASDGGQGIAPGTCTQRIWVVDFRPFFITDVTCFNANPNDGVIWPCDVTLTTCPDDIGDTGEPTVFDDACSLIGVAFEDTRFNFVDGACFKILRKWSVIDWCQYNPLTGAGLWMYTQVIKVHDHDAPEFVNCPQGPVVLCVADPGVSLPDNNQVFLGESNPLASSCSAHLNLCQTVIETCSEFVRYDVKIYPFNGDGFIQVKPTTSVPVDTNNRAVLCFNTRESTIQSIRLNGIPYNSPWCGDYHRILWSVEDDCGNFSFCEYLFRLEDCKQPSPVCINGLSTVVMPIGGSVTIWASDFDASSHDDCTPAEELLFSFSGTTYQPSFTYNCDNIPAFNTEISVNIWVADFGTDDNCNNQISWNERNKDFCTTTIVFTDNANVCGDTTGSVLGEILTEDIQSVEKVAVSLNSPGHVFPTYVTVQDGKYKFENLILPSNFTINAERNDGHKNGVSTLDLVKIQKHLLGIEPLSSPYDLIAADANNSSNVSAIDLIELRKLILGIYTELPQNKSWRFVDKSFVFADASHPWPFEEAIGVDMTGNFIDNQNFVAIKVGDVNNTVQANAHQIVPRNGNGIVSFVTDERNVTVGEMVNVAITSADFSNIEGYQFTLQANGLEFRGVESGLVSMGDDNMGVFGSTLTASWHKVGGVSATSSDVLFTLHFQATAAGKLSQMINLNSRETQAEAYNTASDIKDLRLTFRGADAEAEFALYQNEPNPFKGITVIGYDLPEAGNVTLTVFDVTGKVVYVKEQQSVKGYNTIAVSSKELTSIGVLYYRLDADEYTATKKMVIIE